MKEMDGVEEWHEDEETGYVGTSEKQRQIISLAVVG
jgi:predicted transcriptional regulator